MSDENKAGSVTIRSGQSVPFQIHAALPNIGRHRPCPYCNRVMSVTGSMASTALTMDHIVPATRGGLTKIAVCTRCNHEKANRTLTEWMHFLRFAEADPRADIIASFLEAHPEILEVERIEATHWRADAGFRPPVVYRPVDGPQHAKPWLCKSCSRRFRESQGAISHWFTCHRGALVRSLSRAATELLAADLDREATSVRGARR